jgi:glycosyltransferase involved in cell wall biosynthesis
MRIGIDGHVIGKNIGGVERYVEKVVELAPDLCPQHQFIVLISKSMASRFAGDRRHNVRYVTLPVSDPLIQRSAVLPWLARRHQLDILHVQRIAPWGCGPCRILLTVHDLIPLKYPEAYPGFRNMLVRLLTPGSIARADYIVCPTQFVCDDLGRRYPAATAPRRPFYNGVDRARFTPNSLMDRGTLQRYSVARPFLFSPGAIEERKNIETILKALAMLDAATRPLLLLSGSIRDTSCYARLQGLARKLSVDDSVRHLGFVSDDDLVDLYRSAQLCIAASRDEGFNLLPLEAMACGAPVLCSDIPVHRELYEGAAAFFPPDNPETLAQAIGDALAGQDRSARGPAVQEVLDRYRWEAMAHRMASVFADMAEAGPKTPRL